MFSMFLKAPKLTKISFQDRGDSYISKDIETLGYSLLTPINT